MEDDPFCGLGGYFRDVYPCIPETIFKPVYPKNGVLDSASSPLPEGFRVVYGNAKYTPLFNGSSFRVELDFGNGTVIFYPHGGVEALDNVEFLELMIFYNEELVYEIKK